MTRIILLILFPVLLYSQSVPMLVETPGSSYDELIHDSCCYAAFQAGYGSYKDVFRKKGSLTPAMLDTARKYGCNVVICAYTGAISFIPIIACYPDIGLIMPAGAQEHIRVYSGSLPWLLLTGAGRDSNCTAYPVELYDIDTVDNLDHPSFSNSFLAAKICYLMDALNCSFWDVRYKIRATSINFTEKNGYGIININSVLNYSRTIPANPYFPLILNSNSEIFINHK